MAKATEPTPGFLIWRLAMKWRAAVDRAVAPLGFTHAQYSLLASLRSMTRDGSTPNQRELAEHTGLDPIFVSKLVKTLEAQGRLSRLPDPADARAVQLRLTDEGRDDVDDAIAVVLALHDTLLAPLGGRQSDRTRDLTSALQELLTAPSP